MRKNQILKIDLIVTDMDGTAVQYDNKPFSSSWDALLGILSKDEKKEWNRLRNFYAEKPNLYKEWFAKQVALLKGKRVNDAEKVLFPPPYSPGLLEFFQNNNSFYKAILSGGVDMVAKRITQEAKFDCCVCQQIKIKNGFFEGRGVPFDNLDKKKHLISLAKHFSVSLDRTCYIGDTLYDISCFEISGFPVAFQPRNGLENYVQKNQILSIKDFRELEKILK